jgi:hypothetical protein
VVAKADAAAEPEPAKKLGRPHVVQVFPADGATDVNPLTEIRIRFDQPMVPTAMTLNWLGRKPLGFRQDGEMRYEPATREFILPVQLSPGHKHEIQVNQTPEVEAARDGTRAQPPEGFVSEGGAAAEGFRWSFTTATPSGKAGPAPKIVSVTPPTDSEVALLTPLEVTFDQPMDPRFYGLSVPNPIDFDRDPELLVRADYDAARHRFTLLMRLPRNWNGEVQLTGFRSRDGIPAEPVTQKYRSLRQVLSVSLQRHIEEAGRSAELKQVVERIRKARRELKSVSEDVLMTICFGISTGDRYQTLQSHAARFAMDGDKFLGVVDDIMHIPFRIGGDGKTCWFRSRDDLRTLPSGEIPDKTIRFCDPFDAFGKADAAAVIRELKLEYLGEAVVRDRRCYRIRSWDVREFNSSILSPVRTWSIDAETLLPRRVEASGSGSVTLDFTHTRINQPIPEATFRPDSGPDVHAQKPEPLTPALNRRFLNVIDGSTGRMSVRWGETGPGGRMRSGGLN